MNEEYMNELLANKIAAYTPSLGGKIGAKASVKRLKTEGVMREMNLSEPKLFQDIVGIVAGCGRVLEVDSENEIICAMIMSGIANMNPAIVVLKKENDRMIGNAYAKEGLIKQHTAEKAIQRVFALLGENI